MTHFAIFTVNRNIKSSEYTTSMIFNLLLQTYPESEKCRNCSPNQIIAVMKVVFSEKAY